MKGGCRWSLRCCHRPFRHCSTASPARQGANRARAVHHRPPSRAEASADAVRRLCGKRHLCCTFGVSCGYRALRNLCHCSNRRVWRACHDLHPFSRNQRGGAPADRFAGRPAKATRPMQEGAHERCNRRLSRDQSLGSRRRQGCGADLVGACKPKKKDVVVA